MTALEAGLERRCKQTAEVRGGLFLKLLPWSTRGIPDRLVILPGGVVWFVELKRKGGTPGKLQLRWGEKLRNLGCNYALIDSHEAFIERLWRTR